MVAEYNGVSYAFVASERSSIVSANDENGPQVGWSALGALTADPIDVLAELQAVNGWTQEKLEGFTIAADDHVYGVTDNDGLAAANGETVFLRLGSGEEIFATGTTPTETPSRPRPRADRDRRADRHGGAHRDRRSDGRAHRIRDGRRDRAGR